MTNSTQQALAALDILQIRAGGEDEIATIRSALQHAALETDCWETLFDLTPHVSITTPGGHVLTWTVMIDVGRERKAFDADSRLEALTAAATFCRAEMAK